MSSHESPAVASASAAAGAAAGRGPPAWRRQPDWEARPACHWCCPGTASGQGQAGRPQRLATRVAGVRQRLRLLVSELRFQWYGHYYGTGRAPGFTQLARWVQPEPGRPGPRPYREPAWSLLAAVTVCAAPGRAGLAARRGIVFPSQICFFEGMEIELAKF